MDKENEKFFTNLFGGEAGNKKNKYYWMVLLVLIGVAIMILSSFINIKEQIPPDEIGTINKVTQETSGLIDTSLNPKTIQDYEKIYENQIIEALVDMLGVKEVTVVVNLDSTEEIVVEKDLQVSEQLTKERDKEGGTRDITDLKRDEKVVIYKLASNDQPLILKTLKPRVRGVMIVVEGADNLQTKAMIIEAVQRFLDISPYKIAILPKKGN